jgi:hypothetical protein
VVVIEPPPGYEATQTMGDDIDIPSGKIPRFWVFSVLVIP